VGCEVKSQDLWRDRTGFNYLCFGCSRNEDLGSMIEGRFLNFLRVFRALCFIYSVECRFRLHSSSYTGHVARKWLRNTLYWQGAERQFKPRIARMNADGDSAGKRRVFVWQTYSCPTDPSYPCHPQLKKRCLGRQRILGGRMEFEPLNTLIPRSRTLMGGDSKKGKDGVRPMFHAFCSLCLGASVWVIALDWESVRRWSI